MVDLLNIRGVSEVAPPARKPAQGRVAPEALRPAPVGDAAVFSEESARAAEVARLRALAEQPESEIRAEEVARVRAQVRDGAYRVQEAVLQVAVRVLPIVDQQI